MDPAEPLDPAARRKVLGAALATEEQSNEVFLQKYSERLDRVGLRQPAIPVLFRDISVRATVNVGSRALPTLPNSVLNAAEDVLSMLRLSRGSKRSINILKGLSGILRPGRLTLLMGPPGGGKSTLLKLLSGLLQKDSSLKVEGHVSYNGEPLHKFYPERTAAYVPQTDIHIAKLTVQETLDFSARCLGTGSLAALLKELESREREAGIKPDAGVDAFLRARLREGITGSMSTEMVLSLLGLTECRETLVGDDVIRGVSGGQKKRVSTGDLMVGPFQVLLMDEISTGLDSSTTFTIVRCLKHMAHLGEATLLVALLQPAPEVWDEFDDIMLLADGRMVFHGPRQEILPYFSTVGFQPPERKNPADFVQEVCSPKDQKQYWIRQEAWSFFPVKQLAEQFMQSDIYQESMQALEDAEQKPPADLQKSGLDPLVRRKYALGPWAVFKVCLWREIIIMKRNSLVYISRLVQTAGIALIVATLLIRPTMSQNSVTDGQLYVTVPFGLLVMIMMDNFAEMAILVEGLDTFYLQHARHYYPSWAYCLPTTLMRIPVSFALATVLVGIFYYVIGFDANPGRFFTLLLLYALTHQFALSMFRVIAGLTRSLVAAYPAAWLMFLILLLQGGFILPLDLIHPWTVGAYWALPISYVQNAMAINEFTGERWQKPDPAMPFQTLSSAILTDYSFRHERFWVWVSIPIIMAWSAICVVLLIFALQFLPAPGQTFSLPEEQLKAEEEGDVGSAGSSVPAKDGASQVKRDRQSTDGAASEAGSATKESPSHRQSHGAPHSFRQSDEASGSPTAQQVSSSDGPQQSPSWLPSRQSLDNAASQANGPQRSASLQPHRVSFDQGGASWPGSAQWPQTSQHRMQRQGLRTSSSHYPTDKEIASFKSRRGDMGDQPGLTLPFEPLSFIFQHVYYSVAASSDADDPRNEKDESGKMQLMLLKDVSGAFRPGVLTCLMGASGAGKTTLMDCLSGRKTAGHVQGEIRVNGHPKDQATFARISGYVEQNDIHAPGTTVYEALEFSAQMRLIDVSQSDLKQFVGQVLELMELHPLRNSLVGLPGVSGLSVEQRKRLTIAVELCANPSIIFMDEPTSGLDARAAAIVMRTVRNTVNTGRTVVCTIHQPSIDIFESFDELVLLKRGGRLIYAGPTGHNSEDLVKYFESIQGVSRIQECINPATWMLEVTKGSEETRLGVDFADKFTESSLYKQTQSLIEELKTPPEGSEPLSFPSKYSRGYMTQLRLLMQRTFTEYWRMPAHNNVRLLFTVIFGLVLGAIYWRVGTYRQSPAGINALAGALLLASIFLGTSNASTIQPVAGAQRTVFYRERAAGMYASYPFSAAQAIVELPYVGVQAVLYCCITYWMVYFYVDAGKFFWYLLITLLTLIFFSFWGILAVALTPNIQVSAVLASGFYALWLLFGGFLIPWPSVPGWWIWYMYLDPLYYTVYGLVASQLADVTDIVITTPNGYGATVQQYMHSYYSFHTYFVGVCVAVLILMIAGFHGVTALAHAKLNFLKR